eukprot:scaffold58148_cov66-Attheya_sp.AAC.1
MKKQWILLIGGDLILIPLDGNHRLTFMSSYFYEIPFGTTVIGRNSFDDNLKLDTKSPAWTSAPVECFEYNTKNTTTVPEGVVTTEFQDLCRKKSEIIEVESFAKNNSAYKNMLVTLATGYEQKIKSTVNQNKELGGIDGLSESYLDATTSITKKQTIMFQHRQLIFEMVWEEYTKSGSYGAVSLMKFLGNRTKTQGDIHTEFEKKQNVHGNRSFCNAGR